MTPPQFDVNTEMEKLSETCLSNEDHGQLWNNTVHHYFAHLQNQIMITGALEMIGQTEMRATLNFAPRRSWVSRISKKPSESELASAATIEAYYDLVEPHFEMYRYKRFISEESLIPAIAFLDNRFPFIRAYYRRSFEEIRRRDGGEINRKLVDDMIEKNEEILLKLGYVLTYPKCGNYNVKFKNCEV
ncbi:unnamed protein product [Auanema sp. JU1783]|nr:unnamed protein product [Auanema sp. JU1783]